MSCICRFPFSDFVALIVFPGRLHFPHQEFIRLTGQKIPKPPKEHVSTRVGGNRFNMEWDTLGESTRRFKPFVKSTTKQSFCNPFAVVDLTGNPARTAARCNRVTVTLTDFSAPFPNGLVNLSHGVDLFDFTSPKPFA